MTYMMLALPSSERPRERLLQRGAAALSTAELLAILLGSGMRGKSVLALAQEVLARFGGIDGVAAASVEELCEIGGMGSAKAIQLKAALALAGRQEGAAKRLPVRSPGDAYRVLKEVLEGQPEERLAVVMLDVKSCVIATEVVGIGTLSEALVHPREIFYHAIRRKAASIVLGHNHPSGDVTPSEEDYSTTKALISAGKLLEIPVVDHLVCGGGRWTSLRDKGVDFS